MELFREYCLEAAHRLPAVPPGHPCGRLHGHSYRVGVHLRGPVEESRGWVMDFATVDQAFASVHQKLDHRYLNEVEGLENPTAENLARWIWKRLESELPYLFKIVVWETHDAGCIYSGDEDH